MTSTERKILTMVVGKAERKILTMVVGKAGDLHFDGLVSGSGLDRATVSAAARRLQAMGLIDSNRNGYTAYPGAWVALRKGA